MALLEVSKISKSFGYNNLFEDLSFSLSEGDLISIVGPNGCGKSTLLKIIAGLEKPDAGSLNIKKGTKVSYLDQTAPDKNDDRIVVDVIRDGFQELEIIKKKIDNLLLKLNNNLNQEEYNSIIEQYSKLEEIYTTNGGYEIDTQIGIVCNGLGIYEKMLKQNYNLLSGGQKTIVHLAKALLLKPSLFLLDEPTNHLDIEKIEWLEEYIHSFNGAMVIVSHDRYFLDKVSSKILEIDNGEVHIYGTNYSGYLKEKENLFEKRMADYKEQQLYFKKMEEQIRYFSQKGMAYNSSTLCNRAATLQSQLDRAKSKAITKPKEQKEIVMHFDEMKKSSKTVFNAKNLTIYTEDKKILDDVDLLITKGERVAFIGNNGSGKSTMIKMIVGKQILECDGIIENGSNVKIGYLPQIIEFENNKHNIINYFQLMTGLEEQKARSVMANFKFYNDDILKKLKDLSGGEAIRLKLAVLLQQKINTLIFDEPTNHIDIPTKEVLENAIEDFDGTLVFVSHDRYFINKFADKTIEFKDGHIKTYLGGYDDYKEACAKNIKDEKLF